jgi:hypothetical protein
MLECPVHGLTVSSWCCLHLRDAVAKHKPCELHVIFDDYSDGYLVCPQCLAVAKAYLASVPSEDGVETYPLDLQVICRDHLQEWIAETGGENLDAVTARDSERSGRRSERVLNFAGGR